jgi:choloylglycine hydrolase
MEKNWMCKSLFSIFLNSNFYHDSISGSIIMKNKKQNFQSLSLITRVVVFLVILLSAFSNTKACTWFEFKNDLGNFFIGRTMEWPGELSGEIAVVPRNYKLGPFTTKYGFVGIRHQDESFSDGINELGLACSALWLGASKYPERKEGAYHIQYLITYLLGNTKTVDEAVNFIQSNAFFTSADFALAPGISLSIHFAITDSSGRSIVVEFLSDGVHVHENKLRAMTNDPQYEEQLSNWSNKYAGKTFDASVFEAFDFSAKGRFCRMAAINATQAKVPTDLAAVNRAWSMINTVDIPQGILYWKWVSEYPQFTSYSVVADIKNLVYYFRTYDNYDIRKIDLSKIDFATVKYHSSSIFGRTNYQEFKF